MTSKILSASEAEIREIAFVKKFQRVCKTTQASEVERILNKPTSVKFKFAKMPGSSIGDLFLIQADRGKRRTRSRLFLRMKDGKLELIS